MAGTRPFLTGRRGPYHYTLAETRDGGYEAPQLRAVLEQPDRWLHHPQARVLKAGRSAAIVRLPPPMDGLLLKCYPLRTRWDLFKNLPRSSRARRAFAAAQALPALGIPTATAFGFVDVVIGMVKVRSFLLTRYMVGFRDLRAALLHEPLLAGARSAPRRSVLAELARLLATLHRSGVVHPDLKPVNILLRLSTQDPGAAAPPPRPELALIDLDRVRLVRNVPAPVRRLNFVQLHGSIQERVSYRERLGFLRHYARCGGVPVTPAELRAIERETVDWMGKREDWPTG